MKNTKNKIITYGVDISSKAIKFSKRRFKRSFKNCYFFSTKLDEKELDQFFRKQRISNFDLIIFDRVLFCMNDKEIEEVLLVLTKHTNLIFIDDFYKYQNKSYIGGWKHRNWVKIFHEYGFELKFNNETIYDNVSDSNPRSMLFIRASTLK